MDDFRFQIKADCPIDEIAAYIDGELESSREMELEMHFTGCRACSFELNEQKQFLCSLNSGLTKDRDIELPANFARQIVANAESSVAGLRRPRERYNAVFICVGLFLFVLFAMGAEAGKFLSSGYAFFEQVAMVAGLFGHVVYSVFVGLVIVTRSVASQFPFDVLAGLVLAAFVCVAVVFISRKMLRVRGA